MDQVDNVKASFSEVKLDIDHQSASIPSHRKVGNSPSSSSNDGAILMSDDDIDDLHTHHKSLPSAMTTQHIRLPHHDIMIDDDEEDDGDVDRLHRSHPYQTSNGSSLVGGSTHLHHGLSVSRDWTSQDSCCRTILAFIFLFYNMTLNLFVLAVVHERVPTQIRQPLPDIAFDALPKADWALDVAEYIIVVQMSGVFLTLFIHRYRTIVFRRLCVIMGILYLFRAICMISTVLPRANLNYYCSPQLFNSSDPDSHRISTLEYSKIIFSRVFHMFFGFGLSINGKHNYCGDYLYSGHTVSLTVTYLFLREYLMPSRCRTLTWKLFNGGLFLLSCLAILAILVSRGHYTIDILLAYYVTTRVFWIYHSMVYNHSLRASSSTNYLSRVWWWYLFRYFEGIPDDHRPCESPPTGSAKRGSNPHHHHHHHSSNCICIDGTMAKLPRIYEWPLPWPRWIRRRTNRYRQRLLSPTPPA